MCVYVCVCARTGGMPSFIKFLYVQIWHLLHRLWYDMNSTGTHWSRFTTLRTTHNDCTSSWLPSRYLTFSLARLSFFPRPFNKESHSTCKRESFDVICAKLYTRWHLLAGYLRLRCYLKGLSIANFHCRCYLNITFKQCYLDIFFIEAMYTCYRQMFSRHCYLIGSKLRVVVVVVVVIVVELLALVLKVRTINNI